MTDNNDLTNITFEELFEKYKLANSSKHIVYYFDLICKKLDIDIRKYYAVKTTQLTIDKQIRSAQPATTRILYQIIRNRYKNSWKADQLWELFDKRLKHKDFNECNNLKDIKILIIGCGPVGLRLSIDLALLGFKVAVVEKRDKFSRNNVLHLWPYTIVDLKNLGAKIFYGKFCAGAIDHISIRRLQTILLKSALLLGVEVHFNVSFEELLEPTDVTGWRAKLLPENHVLSDQDFDVVIGADGRRNTLPGFKRNQLRGKLAIGITANFVNYFSNEEANVQERSGVAFIYNQKFFLDLKHETGIDLENIVYYKDDTHYFVMSARKQSLIDKGVILRDLSDPISLLAKDNVNLENLCNYAKEAAYVSTERKLTRLDFAKNHYGQPDVAMFDFTSLFFAENASRIVERKGRKVLLALIGDSLLEPFWPLGTGIARGFLAAFDTAWMIRGFGLGHDSIELLFQRETVYQLLSQTGPDNISKNFNEYSIDPLTRYPNYNRKQIDENLVRHLYDDSDEPINSFYENSGEVPSKKAKSDGVKPNTLLTWSQIVTQPYGIPVENLTTSWKSGVAFCAIIHRFRNDLIDYNSIDKSDHIGNVKLAFDVMRNKLSSAVDATPEEIAQAEVPNKFTILMILDKIYALFRGQPLNEVNLNEFNSLMIPHNNQENKTEKKRKNVEDEVVYRKHKLPNDENIQQNLNNKANKEKEYEQRISLKHISVNNLANLFKSKFESSYRPRSQQFPSVPSLVTSSSTALHTADSTHSLTSLPSTQNLSQINPNSNNNNSNGISILGSGQNSTFCHICGEKVYIMERLNVLGLVMHPFCFRCDYCSRSLRSNVPYSHQKDPNTNKYTFYCTNHVGMTKQNTNGTISRKKSFLNHNDDKNIRPDLTPNTRRKYIDGSDSFRRKYSSFRQRNLHHATKTPERAEFELNIENKNVEENEVTLDILNENDDEIGSQNNSSSGFHSKSVSNADDGDEIDALNDQDDDVEVEDEDIEEEEEDEEEEVDGDDEVIVEDEENVDEFSNSQIEQIKEEKEEDSQIGSEGIGSSDDSEDEDNDEENELKNGTQTNNLSYKLKLANNIINWENNINYNEQVNCISNLRRNVDQQFKVEEKAEIIEPPPPSKQEIKEQNIVNSSLNIEAEEIETNNSQNVNSTNEIKDTENKFDIEVPPIEKPFTQKPYVPNNSFSKLKKFNVNTNNQQVKIEDNNEEPQTVPSLPASSPPPLNRALMPSTVTIIRGKKNAENSDDSNKMSNAKKRVFNCNVCKQVASITQRITIQGLVFHRDCMKCFVCGISVKSAERFIRRSNEQIDFYCALHAPERKIGSTLSIPDNENTDVNIESKIDEKPIEVNVKIQETTKDKQKKINENVAKLLVDETFITTRKKDKTEIINIDEEIGDAINENFILKPNSNINTNENENGVLNVESIRQRAIEKARLKTDEEFGLTTPDKIKHLISPTPVTNDDSKLRLSLDDEKETNKMIFDKIFDQAKEKVKTRIQIKKEEKQNRHNSYSKNRHSTAPLATFDNLDDDDDDDEDELKSISSDTTTTISTVNNSSTNQTNQTQTTSAGSTTSSVAQVIITPRLPKSPKEKSKNLKFVFDGFLPISNDAKTENDNSASTNGETKKSNLKNKFSKLLSPNDHNHDLKSTSPSVSPSPRGDSSSRELDKSPSSQKGKKGAGILKGIFNQRKSPNNRKHSDSDLNIKLSEQQEETSPSFNAFVVTHSPRLTRNSRLVKRQQNEEKRLEKQRRDKRLRMSQEIQRKLDEVETKLAELEQEGVTLEKVICSMDNENPDKKEKLEHELYSLIHQKNLLTRIENELNIQSRALAIEDQLSECQQKLRETIHLPDLDKSRDIMDNERNTMARIVELVEEKNQLVEQLEQLRLIERQEDTDVTAILSGKGFNLYQPNDLNKYMPYKDII